MFIGYYELFLEDYLLRSFTHFIFIILRKLLLSHSFSSFFSFTISFRIIMVVFFPLLICMNLRINLLYVTLSLYVCVCWQIFHWIEGDYFGRELPFQIIVSASMNMVYLSLCLDLHVVFWHSSSALSYGEIHCYLVMWMTLQSRLF